MKGWWWNFEYIWKSCMWKIWAYLYHFLITLFHLCLHWYEILSLLRVQVGCISLKYLCNFQCIYFIMTYRQKHINKYVHNSFQWLSENKWYFHGNNKGQKPVEKSFTMMVLHLCSRTKRKEKVAYSIIDSGICIDASFMGKFFTIL